MLFRLSPATFWNLIASKYAASPIQDQPAYEVKIQKITSYLSVDDNVLDIGCGTGTQCGDIAAKVKQVTGIDISRKLLAIAEQRTAERKLPNVKFVRTSVFDQRFQPGGFNMVMAFFVLHFFEDIDEVFSRIRDLLTPDGLFVSQTACLGEKSKAMGTTLRFLGQLGLLPRMNLLTTHYLEQALEKNGFKLIEKTRFGDKPDTEFTLIARKVC